MLPLGPWETRYSPTKGVILLLLPSVAAYNRVVGPEEDTLEDQLKVVVARLQPVLARLGVLVTLYVCRH